MSIYISKSGFIRDLFPNGVFVTFAGRVLGSDVLLASGLFVSVSARARGGKGGYGQLLKDFGKDTKLSKNTKSLRDLSGRLIRDVDDIADLKKWVKSNPERLQQKKEDKMRRLNRKLVEPKHQIDNSFFFEQKELIEERQTSAFSDLKRKMTEQAKTMQEPVKKKKWYEYEEDDEPKEKVEPGRIEVLAPSEVRSKQFRERLDIEAIKLYGKSAEQLDKNPTVVLENGSVRVATHKIRLDEEAPIWDPRFDESQDPTILKELAIAHRNEIHKRNQDNAESISKSEKEGNKHSSESFGDIDLEKVDSIDALLDYSLDHLKFALSQRKLKTGGALQERAKRLFSVKGLSPDQYPKKVRAKV
ncbi:unnamed protein product [Oikopleura dioica]|uniref:Uncharacterized protein n=1 Tax=Oikopleura dioica TaxID=34765 RepID=E4XCG2_OIKDI|nr:unnamed protein product [Oikopleura dioica]